MLLILFRVKPVWKAELYHFSAQTLDISPVDGIDEVHYKKDLVSFWAKGWLAVHCTNITYKLFHTLLFRYSERNTSPATLTGTIKLSCPLPVSRNKPKWKTETGFKVLVGKIYEIHICLAPNITKNIINVKSIGWTTL